MRMMRMLTVLLATLGSLVLADQPGYRYLYAEFRTPIIAHEEGKEEVIQKSALEQFEVTYDEKFRQYYLATIKNEFAGKLKTVRDVSLSVDEPRIHGVRFPERGQPIGYFAGALARVEVTMDESEAVLVKRVSPERLSGGAFFLPEDPEGAAAAYTKALESYRNACEAWHSSKAKLYLGSKSDVFINASGCLDAPIPRMYTVKSYPRVWKGGRWGAWTPVPVTEWFIKFERRLAPYAPSFFLKTVFD